MTKHAPNDFPDEDVFTAVDPESVGDDDLFVAIFEDTVPLDSDYATSEEWDLPQMHTIQLAQGRSGILRTMVDALEEWLNDQLPSFRDPRTPQAVEESIIRLGQEIERKKIELASRRAEKKKWGADHIAYCEREIRELEEFILPRMRQDQKMLAAVIDLVDRDRSTLDWTEPFDASEMADVLQRWGCVTPDPVLGRIVEAMVKFVSHEGYAFYLTPVTPVRG